MKRNEFDSLSIEKQVEYINNNLENGISVSSSAKEIEIAKSTLVDRFKRNNYKFLDGSYRMSVNVSDEVRQVNVEKNIKDKIKKVSGEKNNINQIDFKKLMDRMDLLEKEIQELKNKKVEASNNKFTINNFSKGAVTKTFKIDIEVYKELEETINKFSIYKKQDVISSLLKYAMDNIK